MRELGLFAGAGGGLLASRLLGWQTVCAVEIEPYCQRVLAQRQRDGHLDPFPIWDDIRTFDGRPWRGCVDVVSGGFPCQDISSAGKRAGLDGARSSLWFEMLRVISEVRPAYVFAENSPNLRTNGLGTVLAGLADLGFDAAWGVLGAWHVGAPHRRNRMWIVAAHPDRRGQRAFAEHAEMGGAPKATRNTTDVPGKRPQGAVQASAESPRSRWTTIDQNAGGRTRVFTHSDGNTLWLKPGRSGGAYGQETWIAGDTDWWRIHRFAGVDDGLAYRVDRVRATGNGQVPRVAALAWRVLSDALERV